LIRKSGVHFRNENPSKSVIWPALQCSAVNNSTSGHLRPVCTGSVRQDQAGSQAEAKTQTVEEKAEVLTHSCKNGIDGIAGGDRRVGCEP
jgi:hypothetical protein